MDKAPAASGQSFIKLVLPRFVTPGLLRCLVPAAFADRHRWRAAATVVGLCSYTKGTWFMIQCGIQKKCSNDHRISTSRMLQVFAESTSQNAAKGANAARRAIVEGMQSLHRSEPTEITSPIVATEPEPWEKTILAMDQPVPLTRSHRSDGCVTRRRKPPWMAPAMIPQRPNSAVQ